MKPGPVLLGPQPDPDICLGIFDGLGAEGTLESTVPAGPIARAMRRAGRNRRKALRRART